jgi:hypothetical protein
MSVPNHGYGSYSADVQMELRVNGRIFDVGQLGPDFVILRDATEHPPADGEMMVSIDGDVKRWPVRLPDGVVPGKDRTRIVDRSVRGSGAAAG